jgi:hypothetical protein
MPRLAQSSFELLPRTPGRCSDRRRCMPKAHTTIVMARLPSLLSSDWTTSEARRMSLLAPYLPKHVAQASPGSERHDESMLDRE